MGLIGELRLKSYIKSLGELIKAEVATKIFEKAGVYRATISMNSDNYIGKEPGFYIEIGTCLPIDISINQITDSWMQKYYHKSINNTEAQNTITYSIPISEAIKLGAISDIASTVGIKSKLEYYFLTDNKVINTPIPGADICGGPYKNFNFYGVCRQIKSALQKVVTNSRNIVFEFYYSEITPVLKIRIFSELDTIQNIIDKEIAKIGEKQDETNYYIANGPYKNPKPTFRTHVVKEAGQTVYEINFLIKANSILAIDFKDMTSRDNCYIVNVTDYRANSKGYGTVLNPYDIDLDGKEEREIVEQLLKMANKSTHTSIRTALISAAEEITELNISESVNAKCKSATFQVLNTIKKYEIAYSRQVNTAMEEQIHDIINKLTNLVYSEHSRERSMSDMDLNAELKAISQFLDLK